MTFLHLKYKLFVLAVVFLIFLYAGICTAKNLNSIIPSEINSDTTLSKAGSPYLANSSVTVAFGAKLTVEAGVEIRFASSVQLIVQGSMDMQGTEESPIILKPATDASRWNGISVKNGSVELRFVQIDSVQRAINADYGNLFLYNCIIRNAISAECVYIKHISKAIIENCQLYGIKDYSKIDAIDCDYNGDGRLEFRENQFFDFSDEAIDIGNSSTNALIENNIIYNCKSMGISIGEGSIARIEGNVITGCAGGIEVHHNAVSYINHNTLYKNGTSIICWHNSEPGTPNTGGTAEIINTILSNSETETFSLSESSLITIDYSLSDTDSLPGTGNLFADPLFINPLALDFRLQSGSPCINSGDPQSPKDRDSSRTDIGAFPFIADSILVINEIHYNPSPAQGIDSLFEFVELHHSGSNTIDLSECHFSSGISFTFPVGSFISPDEYILVTNDSSTYNYLDNHIFQWSGDSLNDDGEILILEDRDGEILDYVKYGKHPPWPALPDGNGPSLELVNPIKDNTDGTNWAASLINGGTPGKQNSAATQLDNTENTLPIEFQLYQNYPNPFNPKTKISYYLPSFSHIELTIFDVAGQKIKTLIRESQAPGLHQVIFNGQRFSSGIYLYHIVVNSHERRPLSLTKKMLLIK